jgi:hypothetical protein
VTPDTFTLTEAQSATLDRLPDDCSVVAADRGSPIVRHGGGRLVRINADGQAVKVTAATRESLERRLIDILRPKSAAS